MAKKSAYLIGIKGVGMTALAIYLKQAGFDVEGSDTSAHFVTDEALKKEGIKVHEFKKENLENCRPDYVIVSGAYGLDNPEVKEAYHEKMKVMYHAEALGMISADKKTIAIAGVHGKTTITAMVSAILENANLDPSFLIGAAQVPGIGPAQKGDGDYFVVEADEYRQSPSNNEPRFLSLNPELAVISSIELDHPDVYQTIEDIYQAFYRLACRVPRRGSIVLCLDYPKCRKLRNSLVDRNFQTYGFSDDAAWQIIDYEEKNVTSFNIKHGEEIIGPFELSIPGKHNCLNAAAAIILAKSLNIDQSIIEKTLVNFAGVQRRFQKIGEVGNIQIFDDYAHHPTAIAKTLEAAKSKFPKAKIWCVFQPHTYSRTLNLIKEFGTAFKDADKVVIAEIFASEREKEGKITGQELAQEIQKHQKNVRFFNDFEKIKKYLSDFVQGPAVIITMGAGDIYKLGEELPKILKAKR